MAGRGAYVIERHRGKAVHKVVMIATDVNNLRPLFLHHLHDDLEEVGMLGLPFAGSASFQSPPVYDVTVQYQPAAVD
jgi:hypothetical protein